MWQRFEITKDSQSNISKKKSRFLRIVASMFLRVAEWRGPGNYVLPWKRGYLASEVFKAKQVIWWLQFFIKIWPKSREICARIGHHERYSSVARRRELWRGKVEGKQTDLALCLRGFVMDFTDIDSWHCQQALLMYPFYTLRMDGVGCCFLGRPFCCAIAWNNSVRLEKHIDTDCQCLSMKTYFRTTALHLLRRLDPLKNQFSEALLSDSLFQLLRVSTQTILSRKKHDFTLPLDSSLFCECSHFR